MHGGDEKCIHTFQSENPKERDHFGSPGVYVKMIMRFYSIRCDSVDWVHLANNVVQ
jgi:hypothetical protein